MTLVLRPVLNADLDAIHHLAVHSGIGITTLSKDINTLKRLISLSVESFAKTITCPYRELYLFALENTLTQEVVGTAAIKACLGDTAPSYTYKVIKRTRIAHDIGVRTDQTWLVLVNQFHQASELCTLYLRPDYRHSHHGVFLSRARFLYMAEHPERFEARVIAELRGVTDSKGHSPFWNHLGYHFVQIPFEEADTLTSTTNKQFIADLIPEHPIPVSLLDKKAQDVIGIPHPQTKPAMQILLNEGFHYVNNIDIFDGGPLIEAAYSEIRSIRASTTSSIIEIRENANAHRCIVSTSGGHFRASLGEVHHTDKGAIISPALATQLNVHPGDTIRLITL